MTIDSQERALRLAFLDFTEEDAERLRELHAFAEQHVHEIVEAFYEHLLKFEFTRGILLRDPETVQRLKAKQRQYFLSLTNGEYGEAYFDGRLRVGDAHQQIDLAPPWYLGTYHLYIRLLLPRLIAAFAHEPERLQGYISSLTKVIFLDMGVALDAYISGGYVNRALGEKYREMADRAAAALAERDAQERTKQTLVDMIVHDIRNPVSGILMTVQLMLRNTKALSAPDLGRVERIEQTANDVLRMIQNILEVSKLEAGMLVTQLEDFAIDSAVRESVEKARPHIEDAQISISLELPATPLLVRADRSLTSRVLQNLLSNSIRHGRAGQIVLKAHEQPDAVLVGVADQGGGIPAEYQQLIFERFRHFDRGTPAHSDTGLGLPFCKLAVEQMGGKIWVESREGKGATFYFTLPKAMA